jgi:hypothetical protein
MKKKQLLLSESANAKQIAALTTTAPETLQLINDAIKASDKKLRALKSRGTQASEIMAHEIVGRIDALKIVKESLLGNSVDLKMLTKQ